MVRGVVVCRAPARGGPSHAARGPNPPAKPARVTMDNQSKARGGSAISPLRWPDAYRNVAPAPDFRRNVFVFVRNGDRDSLRSGRRGPSVTTPEAELPDPLASSPSRPGPRRQATPGTAGCPGAVSHRGRARSRGVLRKARPPLLLRIRARAHPAARASRNLSRCCAGTDREIARRPRR